MHNQLSLALVHARFLANFV